MNTFSLNSTTSPAQTPFALHLAHIAYFFLRPTRIFKAYNRAYFRPDLIAGLTVAVIALPQAVAFALVAELPPETGLYAAIVSAIVGALWGSSNQMSTGPANVVSLLVLSTLMGVTTPGTLNFVIAAGLLSVMVGIFQLVVGLTGLGVLINFVSHSVVVGFSAGAGLLIALGQVRYMMGVEFSSLNLIDTTTGVVQNLGNINLPTFLLGLTTMLLIVVFGKLTPKAPYVLMIIALEAFVVYWFELTASGVEVLGEIPRGLPPLADLPLLDFELIGRMSTGAMAVGAIGLIQTMAISRSIAVQTGQRLDSSQEFVGQGLANVTSGFFSGCVGAGSFSRSAVNLRSGAKTPVSNVFVGLFILAAMLAFAPLAAYVPRVALAGVLIVTAFGMIDKAEIVRILQGTRGDALIMLVTFLGTMFLNIEFAVLLGIILSFALYIMKSSVPTVQTVVPDISFKHFVSVQPGLEACPQLGIVQIAGDLYFGAVSHVEETLHQHLVENPEQRFLLLRMHSVNQCDFSGIHMLETVRQSCLDRGGDIYFVRLKEPVYEFMKSTRFYDDLGEDHFLDEDQAITFIFYKILDPAICIYECPVKVFKECQNLPKISLPLQHQPIPLIDVENIAAKALWKRFSNGSPPPLVIDVREPREFKQGHIPAARLLPLPHLMADVSAIPADREVVFVCRGGRRSTMAARLLKSKGHKNVKVLRGGMLAWEGARLLQAIDE